MLRASLPVICLLVILAGACGGSDEPERKTLAFGTGAACEVPYSPDSPWNTPVPAGAERTQTAALSGPLSSDPTQFTYPVYYVDGDSPRVRVTTSGWFSEVSPDGTRLDNQRRGIAQVPIPDDARPAAGSDAQMVIIDRDTGDEWGASNLVRQPDGSWEAWNVYRYNGELSGVPPRDDEDRPFFLRGAGVPYLAGLVRPCEIAQGRIEHALAFAYDFPTDEYIYPATKSDGDGEIGRDIPEGTRLQLDPEIGADELIAAGCSDACLVIAVALQEYGMYTIDNSGRAKVMVEFEETADWNGLIDEKTVAPLSLSDFAVVDSPPPTPGSTATPRRDDD